MICAVKTEKLQFKTKDRIKHIHLVNSGAIRFVSLGSNLQLFSQTIKYAVKQCENLYCPECITDLNNAPENR